MERRLWNVISFLAPAHETFDTRREFYVAAVGVIANFLCGYDKDLNSELFYTIELDIFGACTECCYHVLWFQVINALIKSFLTEEVFREAPCNVERVEEFYREDEAIIN